MSAAGSPIKSGKSRSIPTRRILINDPSQLPHDYSSTPGGTIFSTTPGGTRLIYDRAFLLRCRNSPLTRSPPANMAVIPGVTSPGEMSTPKENGSEQPKGGDNKTPAAAAAAKAPVAGDDPQFEMDI
ncbi:eukaryotic translation initiation factor 4E-binding protein 2-like isoform X2 [Liolophura sinensis]|uniref:eukaryotic translation initiation factor 4E-binding protein 2-like isoform X2 n=1 Tax=Liolophura sinensis TaxID=3198878 RepID=UPI003158349A